MEQEVNDYGLNAIKGIANGFVVKGLMTLVEKAIVMLGAC